MPAANQHRDRVIDAAAGHFDPERRELFAEFAAVFLNGVESHHAGGEDVLSALALEAFASFEQRVPGETRVRVHNPEYCPAHTVVEVLQDDRPFIVDSLRLALRHFDVQERLVVHPILWVERDAEGRLQRVEVGGNSEPRESYVYIEFVPRIAEGATTGA
jgi:NAD-specific glutamate dehydrogenase